MRLRRKRDGWDWYQILSWVLQPIMFVCYILALVIFIASGLNAGSFVVTLVTIGVVAHVAHYFHALWEWPEGGVPADRKHASVLFIAVCVICGLVSLFVTEANGETLAFWGVAFIAALTLHVVQIEG